MSRVSIFCRIAQWSELKKILRLSVSIHQSNIKTYDSWRSREVVKLSWATAVSKRVLCFTWTIAVAIARKKRVAVITVGNDKEKADMWRYFLLLHTFRFQGLLLWRKNGLRLHFRRSPALLPMPVVVYYYSYSYTLSCVRRGAMCPYTRALVVRCCCCLSSWRTACNFSEITKINYGNLPSTR